MSKSRDPSGWTLDTLYAHLTAILFERDRRYGQRFSDLDAATKAALAASEKAVTKAEDATERRFAGVNEFRATLSDQAAQFITRAEAEAGTALLRARVQELTDRLNRSEGKGAGLNAGWVILLGAVSAIGTLAAIYLALNR